LLARNCSWLIQPATPSAPMSADTVNDFDIRDTPFVFLIVLKAGYPTSQLRRRLALTPKNKSLSLGVKID
jgi:hypothetical protein